MVGSERMRAWSGDVGRRLFWRREEMTWLSRGDLASRVDMSTDRVSAIECGAAVPTAGELSALAHGLESNLAELFPDAPPSADLDARPLLGQVVRSRRLELGLTQKQVAKQMREAGFSTWSSTKMGSVDIGDRDNITIRELWALSVILDFDVKDAFPRSLWF